MSWLQIQYVNVYVHVFIHHIAILESVMAGFPRVGIGLRGIGQPPCRIGIGDSADPLVVRCVVVTGGVQLGPHEGVGRTAYNSGLSPGVHVDMMDRVS